MNLLDNYINKDVVNHFAGLISDLEFDKMNIMVFDKGIFKTITDFKLSTLLPDNIFIEPAPGIFYSNDDTIFIDKIIDLLNDEKTIITIKDNYIDIKGSEKTLRDLMNKGADVRIVDNILESMVVASKKRRNNVIYPIDGYEDEALITAAGLAKAKTVGFRRFYVFQNHRNTPETIRAIAGNKNTFFLVPLKTGLNTGPAMYSEIPLLYSKGVVFSGYELKEIVQSIYMLAEQHANNSPKVIFQRTKEVNDEVISRARWMIDEVFDKEDYTGNNPGIVKNGKMKINEKYEMFDAGKLI